MPTLMTMGRPHRSHTSLDGSSGTLTFLPSMFFSACSRLAAKPLIEVVHGLVPVGLAAFHLIQVLLHLGGEVHIHDVGELLQHQAVHGPAQQGGLELFLVPLHIAAVDDGGDDGRVGGGAADAVLFQRLDEGGFGVAGGGLGELLLALQLLAA